MVNNKFTTIFTQNQDANRVQGNVANSLNNINGPFVDGNLIKGVAIQTSNTTIAHGLGREPQIFVVADNNANAVIYRVSWDNANAILKASANCTASIWFG